MAGGGNIVLDNNGISVLMTSAFASNRAYRFMDSTGATLLGELQGKQELSYEGGTRTNIELATEAIAGNHARIALNAVSNNRDALISLLCMSNSVNEAYITIEYDQSADKSQINCQSDYFLVAAQQAWFSYSIKIGLDTALTDLPDGVLGIFNGTSPTSSPANGVQLYAQDVSSSSELRVRDEAGNVTTLSPHNFRLIPGGASEPLAWAYYGERDGVAINVDMLKLARWVEKLSGDKLVYTNQNQG